MSQVQLIELPSRISLPELDSLQGALQSVLDGAASLQRLILDFGKTCFIDSSGVVYLRQFFRAAQQQGIDLIGWSLAPHIQSLLHESELTAFLEVDADTAGVAPVASTEPALHPAVTSRWKRALDVAGAVVGLGVTGLLFVPIAVAIKLESPGPILFSQTRCGHRGRTFKIWKFRSMVANAPELKHLVENQISGAFFKNENDPRITKVGRFLRKTSLDEFPQFWNVLKGDMSLVGTRPPTLDEVENYQAEQGQRLEVKPGLTGEWQVNGRSQVKSFEQVVEMDLSYQQKWSIGYDLKLIFKTIAVLFSKRSGAC